MRFESKYMDQLNLLNKEADDLLKRAKLEYVLAGEDIAVDTDDLPVFRMSSFKK